MGNPINQGTGNKLQLEVDYGPTGISPLLFNRYYNNTATSVPNIIGNHWQYSYARSIKAINDKNAKAIRDDSKTYSFRKIYDEWVGELDITDSLTELKSNGTRTGWQYVTEDNQTETYDATGKLLRIKDAAGITQTLTYSTAATPVSVAPSAGLLLAVVDSFGRSLAFTYDSAGRLVTLTDPAGNAIRYGYDGNGNLTTATYADGSVKTYVYGELAYTGGVSQPNALTGIIDENGVRYGVYQYEASGKAISTEHAVGGIDRFQVSYAADGSSANITDPLGTVRTTHFTTILGVVKSTGSDQPAGAGCNAASNHISYDSNGNIASRTDFNGNVTTYSYDMARNLETSRTEAAGSPQARTISTQWHDSLRLPVKTAEPKKLTTITYDAQGNVLTRSEQASTDSTGAAGLNPTLAGTPRTWRYTYNSLGQRLTEDGPRTDVNDVTSYAYYTDTTSDHHSGDLASVTDALGHTTTYSRYDGNGRVLTYNDANGLLVKLAYDARGRLLSRSVDGNSTQYAYDGVGNLSALARPGQGTTHYRYDAAYRLLGITDAVGNSIEYTLDALGNTTQTVVKNPDGSVAKSQSTQFDALGRVQQAVGAQNQASQYGYDANGNLKSAVDPNNHPPSLYAYDALDRLQQAQDAAGGVSAYGYDGLDQLTQVATPNGAYTQYSVDALGNHTAEAGPDRGNVQASYDEAGNLKSLTDARGITVNYTYDALNRLLTVTYPNAGEDISYHYDTASGCSNGLGRLCQVSDASGSTLFSYDQRGNLTQESRTEAGHSYTTRYSYDAAGQLSQLTNPDNRPVNYSRDAAGRITGVSAPANSAVLPVVSQIARNALGLVTQQTFANGFVQSQGYDSDGQPITTTALDSVATGGTGGTGGTGSNPNATVPLPAWALLVLALVLGRRLAKGKHTRWPWLSLMVLALLPALALYSDKAQAADSLSYDANGNISQRVQGGTTFTYTYDPLDRLLSEAGIQTQNFTYDANGNRLTDGSGSYSYPNHSNQLAAAPGKTLSYDLSGNLTGDGRFTYTYNQAGQLSQVSRNGTVIASYAYDYRGRRTQKTVNNTTTVFVYDPNGYPIAEASSGGTVQKTYLWRDDTPAVVIDSTGAQDQLYYLQADPLNSPRAARNQAGTVVWSWPQDAFGSNPANPDPDGNRQTTQINLRFPGQYYDAETGLHYN
ncbi:MAG: DUF6531 domain-containing protein [Methylococcaceae bacterium]